MNLALFQHQFVHSILNGDNTLLQNKVQDITRVAIYRHNCYTASHHALSLTYPCIEKLVGEGFFVKLVNDYTLIYPPATGNLDMFGKQMQEFLTHYPPVVSLPYLSFMAELEWFIHESSLAGSGQVINIEALRDIPPEQFGDVYLKLHPSVRLLFSDMPVVSVYEFCIQNGDVEVLNLQDLTGECALIMRPWRKVSICRLSKDEALFLKAVAEGKNIEAALDNVMMDEEAVDLAMLLQKHFNLGTFSGFSLSIGG